MEENYILTEVTNNKLNRAFLEMPVSLYRNDKNWIRPLDDDINKIFDPNRNKLHKNGESVRWILYDSHGKAVGRIAAFYNNDNSDKEEQPTGGIGFFECINDQEAADTMFDAAIAWLKDKGMEAMDGPINFGSRETFWGCLHDGFYPPNYNMPYNYKYYNDLFTNYGFKIYFYQYTFHMKLIPDSMDPVIYEKGRNIQHNNEYNFRNIDKNNLDKYVDDFLTVFNETWARFPGVKPLSKAQTTKMFDKLKIILDPRVMIFAYYKERPIGFFIMIPDLYEVTKHFNGKFNLINKLRLIYNLKVRKISRKVIGLIFGVVPDFQNKGVADGMILTFEDEVRKKNFKYTDLEMNWIGDFNTAMIKLEEYLGATIRKKHITYRYLFDRNKEFKRAQRL
jgi:GNAT superfamily N-acetyltransferase